MDLAVNLGLTSALHIHSSGALTFCPAGSETHGWDDDAPLLTVEA